MEYSTCDDVGYERKLIGIVRIHWSILPRMNPISLTLELPNVVGPMCNFEDAVMCAK